MKETTKDPPLNASKGQRMRENEHKADLVTLVSKTENPRDDLRWLALPFISVLGALLGAIFFWFFSLIFGSAIYETGSNQLRLLNTMISISSFAVFGWLYALIILKLAGVAPIKPDTEI